MKKIVSLILLITCLAQLRATSQTGTYISVNKAEEIPWERIESSKRFIVAGEAHNVSINFPFQLSHLNYLTTKGFRNLVWEMPYSYGFIAQQYISTSNDSLLPFIAWSQEDMA